MKKDNNDEIMVSINCITYNHENYIADAIESFLMQKVNFKYEILIHDDASTDGTAEIIKKYEKEYPNIIKPIYQIENQYSKGVKVSIINNNRALGKYIAWCEGDDYWTDPLKLQKQVDFMENNLDYSMCVHSVVKINVENGKVLSAIRPTNTNREISIEEIIWRGGGIFGTNSCLYRNTYTDYKPDFYFQNKFSFGDYQLFLYRALLGKVYYLDEVMAAYRINVPGSWTLRSNINLEAKRKNFEEVVQFLIQFNENSNFKYDKTIEKTIGRHKFKCLLLDNKIKEVKNGRGKEYYKNLDIISKLKINLEYYSPNLMKFLHKIKGRLA